MRRSATSGARRGFVARERAARARPVGIAGATLLAMSACAGTEADAPAGSQPVMTLDFEVTENRAASHSAALTLTNDGDAPLAGGWTLYFNLQRTIEPESVPPDVTMGRVNGDFQSLRPTEAWQPLAPGEARRITYDAQWTSFKISDALTGAYVVFDEGGGPVPVPARVGPIAQASDPVPGRPADQPLIPTPSSRFAENALLSRLAPGEFPRVVPTPRVQRVRPGGVTLDASWRVLHGAGLGGEARFLARELGRLFGSPLAVEEGTGDGERVIRLSLGAVSSGEGSPEAYRLDVTTDGVHVTGAGPAGVFYGVQSLRALIDPEAYEGAPSVELDAVTIEDGPRFGYRGLHLDVARNFQTRETVEKLLDLMAFYKLNRFHLHLTDDEGWRLEVPGLPELTGVGGRRGHTLDERDHLVPSFGSGADPDPAVSYGSGHYTHADLVALLRYAAERHIRVVPEIDVPGHARAAVKAMEARYHRLVEAGDEDAAAAYRLADPDDRSQYRSVQGWNDNVVNVCLESTYRFLGAVLDELESAFSEAGAELTAVHIGGDEVPRGVWERSPACEALVAERGFEGRGDLFAYFVDRLSSMIQARGLRTAGWEEIALVEGDAGVGKRPDPALLDRDLQPYVWNNVWGGGAEDLGYRIANAGYPVVLANATNLYFDLAYDRDPAEPGFTWAGLTSAFTAWEFAPLDLFQSARETVAGRPIDPESEFADRVRLTDAGRGHVLGIQGQVWGENARGRAMMEYLAFPKTLGLAERAWAAAPGWARIPDRASREPALMDDWNRFANALGQRELPRLDRLYGGVAYRIPPPGAVVDEGVLRANTAFPGLVIRYTTDGTEPGMASPSYDGPVEVTGDVRLRTFDSRGRGSREIRVPAGGA